MRTTPLDPLLDAEPQELDLVEACLAIGELDDPPPDKPRIRDYLLLSAEAINDRLPAVADIEVRLETLRTWMYGDQGFRGNTVAYYEPANSLLHRVIARRKGIPISLAIILIEVGRRIGLPLTGIAFPAHFLVACQLPTGDLLLDPFQRARALGPDELHQRLGATLGRTPSTAQLSASLVPANNRAIAARVLRNLKTAYARGRAWERVAAVLDILIKLQGHPWDIRDRARAWDRLECLRAALADYERYLELAPTAPDAGEVRRRIAVLKPRTQTLQ